MGSQSPFDILLEEAKRLSRFWGREVLQMGGEMQLSEEANLSGWLAFSCLYML